MAGKEKWQSNLTDKDTLFVGRLVYDVMAFTLSKCGLPKSALPEADCKANVYTRPDVVRLAAAPALRAALFMRDKWRPMFISRRKNTGLDANKIGILMGQLQFCCPLSRDRTKQSGVEVFLALCNEMILFCHYEKVDLDPIQLIKATATVIILTIGPCPNMCTAAEELFRYINDIGRYTRWLTNFIAEYAIPYGSREVSDIFTERSHNRYLEVLKETACPEAPEVQQVRDRLGFLPHDVFSAVKVEESMALPDDLLLCSGSTLPGDRESPEPPRLPKSFKDAKKQINDRLGISKDYAFSEAKTEGFENSQDLLLCSGSILPGDRESPEPPGLPESSKDGSGEGSSLRGRKQKQRISDQTATKGQRTQSSSELEIEDDFKQMSFDSSGQQGSQNVAPNRKKSQKSKRKSSKK